MAKAFESRSFPELYAKIEKMATGWFMADQEVDRLRRLDKLARDFAKWKWHFEDTPAHLLKLPDDDEAAIEAEKAYRAEIEEEK